MSNKRDKKLQQEEQPDQELEEIQNDTPQAKPRKRRKPVEEEVETPAPATKGRKGMGINMPMGGGQKRVQDDGEDDEDDGDIENGAPKQPRRRRKTRGNQDLWLLYLLFKAGSFLCYFFLPIVFPKALSYIVVLMMTALDFWIVKNIVGRKLVKLRWWYIIDNEGNERWHYESKDVTVLFQDKLVFWGFLVIHPVLWGLFFVMNAITLAIFESSITIVCGLIAAVQFYGFRQCSNAHARKQKIIQRRAEGRLPGRGGRGGRGRRGRGGLQEPLMQNNRYQS